MWLINLMLTGTVGRPTSKLMQWTKDLRDLLRDQSGEEPGLQQWAALHGSCCPLWFCCLILLVFQTQGVRKLLLWVDVKTIHAQPTRKNNLLMHQSICWLSPLYNKSTKILCYFSIRAPLRLASAEDFTHIAAAITGGEAGKCSNCPMQ